MTKVISGNKPERSDIFDIFANKIPAAKAISGIEIINDLQMDLILRMFDALLANKTVTMTDAELQAYSKMKDQWNATKDVDFDEVTYEIDYAFNGDGQNGNPYGLKRLAREAQKEYKLVLQKHGYTP